MPHVKWMSKGEDVLSYEGGRTRMRCKEGEMFCN